MTRHLQFRVEDDVYRACEEAAEARGMSLSRYGAKMVAEWLGKETPDPLGDLDMQEERILRGLLAYLREKPYSFDKEEYVMMLDRLAKRYAGK